MHEAFTDRHDHRAAPTLALIQEANREQVTYHLVDDRLIVHPHRTRQDIVDALIARADEVAAFLSTHRRYVWRTPPEEEEYRRKMANEMCLAMFGMEWQALINIAIDRLADVVGEAWERHVARMTPLPSLPYEDAAPPSRKRRARPNAEPDRVVY